MNTVSVPLVEAVNFFCDPHSDWQFSFEIRTFLRNRIRSIESGKKWEENASALKVIPFGVRNVSRNGVSN